MRHVPRIAALAAAALGAIAACDAGTGGARVTVSLAARSAPEGGSPLGVFTTDTGWSVVLTEAKVIVGAVYAFAPDPDALTAFRALLGPSVARAHGGVDPLSGRAVRAEWIAPFAVDALTATPVDAGAAVGEAGTVDAVELRFVAPNPALAPLTGGHHAYFAGTATKGAAVVDFAGGVDLADVGTERRVEGIVGDYLLDEGGLVTLDVHAATFFRGVQFDTLPPADPITFVHPLAVGGQPYAAIELGLRNPVAYATSYQPGGAP